MTGYDYWRIFNNDNDNVGAPTEISGSQSQ